MKLWPLFSLILLAPQAGRIAAGSQKGDDALANGLWEIAGLHYRQALADPSLTPEAKSEVAVHLAESLIRAGNPADALELLAQSFVENHPETPFWKAQALAGQNRFSDAAGILSALLADASAPHLFETGMTLASLQLALEQPDAALETLSKLLPSANAETAAKIRLYQVEILIDLKRVPEARAAMPEAESVAAEDRPLAMLLDAHLQLSEGKPADAETGFRWLVSHPQDQSLIRFHTAAIGLADAIHARGNPEEAAMSLLTFLQEHPESPVLEPIFKRILGWLPEKPASTDPVLEFLDQWIPPALLPATGPIADASSPAISAWPNYSEITVLTERGKFALFTRAIGLHRIGTPESRAEANRLLRRLRVEHPDHPLAARSLYQSARWLLDAGEMERAFSILDTLRETAQSPGLRGEAAYLEARAAYLLGDTEKAIKLFDAAASTLAMPEAKQAKLHAAIARLRSGDPKSISPVISRDTPPEPELEADLQLERALSTQPASEARTALEEFLKRFPDHSRADEARLAAAEAALTGPAPDLPFAIAQLDLLAADPADSPTPRIALARLRIADLSKDPAATIAAAESIIDTYPGDPAVTEAGFTLGRNLFQDGSYNRARLVMEELAASDTNPARAQAAWLLAARSAALGGTPQSKDEALILFDKAIEIKGPLTGTATLEKSSHLIDMYRLAEASAFLTRWTKALPEADPLQLPAGLLLGEALYAQGSDNPASLIEALAVYDKLLAQAKNQPSLFNRLQYLRGMTLEQLPDPNNPAKKREGQALQAYYSVLETDTPPVEWEYFERCGFSALALLEKAKRWQAAVNVARKIASFNGPRAEEAATRADKIQLEQMIW